MIQEARLQDSAALSFALAGNATLTLRSTKTGARYTYRVRQAEDKPGLFFVSFLRGSDNEGDYSYMGLIRGGKFQLTAKSQLKTDSLPVLAFEWVFRRLSAGAATAGVEIWHAGKCGRCGRTLTVPESIQQGFGPECVTKMAVAA